MFVFQGSFLCKFCVPVASPFLETCSPLSLIAHGLCMITALLGHFKCIFPGVFMWYAYLLIKISNIHDCLHVSCNVCYTHIMASCHCM